MENHEARLAELEIAYKDLDTCLVPVERRLTELESVCAKLKHQLPAAPATEPSSTGAPGQPVDVVAMCNMRDNYRRALSEIAARCNNPDGLDLKATVLHIAEAALEGRNFRGVRIWAKDKAVPDASARESVWVEGCGFATGEAVEGAYERLRQMRRLPSVEDELSKVRTERDSLQNLLDTYDNPANDMTPFQHPAFTRGYDLGTKAAVQFREERDYVYLQGFEAGCRMKQFREETLAQIQSNTLCPVDTPPPPVVQSDCKPAATEPSNASPA